MEKKIKILLFTDTLCDLNGVSRFIQDMSKEALKQEVAFFVLTSSLKESCPSQKNIYNLKPLFSMKMPFYKELDLVIPSYREMKALTKEIAPDIIHISTPGMVGYIGRLLAKKQNIPIIGTYHTDFPKFIYSNIPVRWVEKLTIYFMRYFYKNFMALFVRSNEYMQIAQEHTAIEPKRIYLLQAGTNTDKFNQSYLDSEIWDEYDVPLNHTKALYVGRLSKEKNFPLLLEYWSAYFDLSSNKNVSLIVVGSGEMDTEQYEAYNIRFLGEQKGEALSRIYASSDFFLFPSTTDTLGQVVMEAMSSGLSVVVSDKGGAKTLIDEDKPAGYIVDSRNKVAWVHKIKMLVSDVSLREELSQNAMETMKYKGITHSFEQFMQKHIEIID